VCKRLSRTSIQQQPLGEAVATGTQQQAQVGSDHGGSRSVRWTLILFRPGQEGISTAAVAGALFVEEHLQQLSRSSACPLPAAARATLGLGHPDDFRKRGIKPQSQGPPGLDHGPDDQGKARGTRKGLIEHHLRKNDS